MYLHTQYFKFYHNAHTFINIIIIVGISYKVSIEEYVHEKHALLILKYKDHTSLAVYKVVIYNMSYSCS